MVATVAHHGGATVADDCAEVVPAIAVMEVPWRLCCYLSVRARLWHVAPSLAIGAPSADPEPPSGGQLMLLRLRVRRVAVEIERVVAWWFDFERSRPAQNG